ncbi:transposase IS4 family protein [Collimonas fungivorans]|uniref:Transposase IS4 family protein n=1 Tax=Collimonas fungivorans TaxID=158899 RepID=A0A127P5Y6_9BURK|nr:transposase IS4 family protein [Collimonas fungivorans]
MRSGVANSDILKSFLGLLCIGETDFDTIENFRGNDFSMRTLGVNGLPLSPTLHLYPCRFVV